MGCTNSQPELAHPQEPKRKEKEAFLRSYQLGERLGKGSFAQVRVVTRPDLPEDWPSDLAVKIQDLRVKKIEDDEPDRVDVRRRTNVVQEARIWKLASCHPNIVAFCDAKIEGCVSFLVMERCDFTLKQYLKAGAGEDMFTERSWGKTLHEMLEALAHIHSLNIVHNDIKPDNFIVRQKVKLCDFGMASQLQDEQDTLAGKSGTAPYMSPEMLNEQGYGLKTDIFAVGVIAYLMLFGDFPYRAKNAKDMRQAIREGKELPSFQPAKAAIPTVSTASTSFATALLERDPTNRVTAAGAMRLPFLCNLEAMPQTLPDLLPAVESAARKGCFGVPVAEDPDKDPLEQLLAQVTASSALSSAGKHLIVSAPSEGCSTGTPETWLGTSSRVTSQKSCN